MAIASHFFFQKNRIDTHKNRTSKLNKIKSAIISIFYKLSTVLKLVVSLTVSS